MNSVTKMFLIGAAAMLGACITSNDEGKKPRDYLLHTGPLSDSLMGGRMMIVVDSTTGNWFSFPMDYFARPLTACSISVRTGKSDSVFNFEATSGFDPFSQSIGFSYPTDSTFTHYRLEVDCRN